MPVSGEKNDFPTTNWSMVDHAVSRAGDVSTETLDQLLTRYLPALYAYLITTWRMPEATAKDHVQSFVADKIMRDDLFAKADRERGRFRHLLTTALDRYVISQHRRENALRRSPGEDALIPLHDVDPDELGAQPVHHASFDIVWAQTIIQEVLRRVEDYFQTSNRVSYWRIFHLRVVRPHLEGQPPASYDELVKKLDFASPAQASNALLTVKRKFARTFREVITEYVKNKSMVDSEIGEIRTFLARYSDDKSRKGLKTDEDK